MIRTLLLSTAVAAGLILASPRPADAWQSSFAQVGAGFVQVAQSFASLTEYMGAIGTWITDTTTWALQGLGMDMASNTNKEIQGQAMIADGQAYQNVDLQRQLARANAEGGRWDLSATQCSTATSAQHLGAMHGRVDTWTSQGVAASLGWSAPGAGGRRGGGGGGSPAAVAAAAGPQAAGRYVVEEYRGFQNDPETYEQVPGSSDRINMALNGAVLIERSRNLTDRQAQAAGALVRHLIDPNPVAVPDFVDDEAWGGQHAAAEIRARMIGRTAGLLMSSGIANEAVARRRAQPGLEEWINAIRSENAAVTIPDRVGVPNDGQISLETLLRVDVLRRYANPSWFEQIAQQGGAPESLLKELVIMTALQTMLQYETMRAAQQAALVSAAHYAMDLRNRPIIDQPAAR